MWWGLAVVPAPKSHGVVKTHTGLHTLRAIREDVNNNDNNLCIKKVILVQARPPPNNHQYIKFPLVRGLITYCAAVLKSRAAS